MTGAVVPWFVDVLLLLPGPVLIGLAVPLYRQTVPPNWIYGVRFRATLADPAVWYAINARGGRDLIVLSLLYLGLTTAFIFFGQSLSLPFRLIGPLGFLIVALLGDSLVLAVAARRMLARRRDAEGLSNKG